MKTIEEQLEELKKQQKEQDIEIARLEKELEAKKDWRSKLVQPSVDVYAYICNDNKFCLKVSSDINSPFRKPEHAFSEVQHAELVKEKKLLMQEMLAFAHVKNDGKPIDWSDGSAKYGIITDRNKLKVISYYDCNLFCYGVALHEREHAQEMLEEFGERLEKYYNVQY